jgi:hypothetical protein
MRPAAAGGRRRGVGAAVQGACLLQYSRTESSAVEGSSNLAVQRY